MRLKGFVAVLATAAIACGGDEATGPSFPQASGTYSFHAEFDALPVSQANVNGTITFAQPNPAVGSLDAFANLTIVIGGSTGSVNQITNASVGADRRILFQVPSSSISTSWTFDATLSADGSSMSGRHTLSGSTSTGNASYSGNWTATKQ
jgi:hypothetical protein